MRFGYKTQERLVCEKHIHAIEYITNSDTLTSKMLLNHIDWTVMQWVYETAYRETSNQAKIPWNDSKRMQFLSSVQENHEHTQEFLESDVLSTRCQKVPLFEGPVPEDRQSKSPLTTEFLRHLWTTFPSHTISFHCFHDYVPFVTVIGSCDPFFGGSKIFYIHRACVYITSQKPSEGCFLMMHILSGSLPFKNW